MPSKDTKLVKSGERKPPAAGRGRVKGAKNKIPRLLKEAIVLAAEHVGFDQKGEDGLVGYCKWLAINEPKAFAALMGRTLPLVQSSDPDSPITFKIIYENRGD